ncbi:MAG: adenosine deaminase family protein [Chloroflexi bacterium]|nr:adenosine deaminase family protein [Chloroflexota bacterium]
MDVKPLPKAELHCHMDGILDREMVRDIRRDDPAFPIDPREFERAYPIYDLKSFWNWWNFIDPIEGKLENFYPILGRYVERLKAQNVCYAEIMLASGELAQDTVEAVEEVIAFREWIDQQEDDKIQVEFLVAFGRNATPDKVTKLAEKLVALYEASLIFGVAVAGPEQGNPIKPFQKTMAKLREAGLGIEIHAGEWCGPESVWDALDHGYPDRIGHGVSLFQDERLLDLVQERRIHIEMCPTSNLKTGSVARIEEHPVHLARELGLSFSINTDDPGPFGCSMVSEYELLSNVFGFNDEDFQTIYVNSLKARFQPELRVNKFACIG